MIIILDYVDSYLFLSCTLASHTSLLI